MIYEKHPPFACIYMKSRKFRVNSRKLRVYSRKLRVYSRKFRVVSRLFAKNIIVSPTKMSSMGFRTFQFINLIVLMLKNIKCRLPFAGKGDNSIQLNVIFSVSKKTRIQSVNLSGKTRLGLFLLKRSMRPAHEMLKLQLLFANIRNTATKSN